MRVRTTLLMALLLASVACDQRAAFERLIPKEDEAFAMSIFDTLRLGNVGGVEALLDKSLQGADARSQLERLAAFFGREAPQEVRVIGSLTNVVNGETTYVNLTLEYRFAKRWLLATMALHRAGGVRTIDGLYLLPTVDSQEHLNRFTFAGKGVSHYLMLSFALVVPVFIVGTLVLVWRTRVPRRKWLWAIFVAIGIGQFTINWTTGQVSLQLLHVSLLGSGFVKLGPYAPLSLWAAVPVGAIVFLARRRRWLAADTPQRPASGGDADGGGGNRETPPAAESQDVSPPDPGAHPPADTGR